MRLFVSPLSPVQAQIYRAQVAAARVLEQRARVRKAAAGVFVQS